jgi:hypothetical protein
VLGASPGELAFVAVLVVIVMVAQIAPRIGEAIAMRGEAGKPSAGTSDKADEP